MNNMKRCTWANHPDMHAYHDREWGVPVHDDNKHFEFLILEAAQAGLSWSTILRRREGYGKAFAGFDPKKVAQFTINDVERLVQDASIIRNRRKIESAVNNAKRFLEVQVEYGSFDNYIWSFTGNKTIKNGWRSEDQIPAESKESSELSKDMKKRGFTFCGPVIMYAHMQAVGVVNDHLVTCFRYKQL